MNNLQGVIEKVARLRALSTSSNVHEATAAAALAEKLIAQYRLSEADLEIEGEESEMVEEEVFEYGHNLSSWKCSLIVGLSKHYGCVGIISSNPRMGKPKRHISFGRKSDIELVKYMFSWLSLEIARLSQGACKGRGKSFSNSFCHGAVCGVLDAMHRESEVQRTRATSTALAVVDARLGQSQKFMTASRGEVKKSANVGSVRDANAYHAGKRAGASINRASQLTPTPAARQMKG